MTSGRMRKPPRSTYIAERRRTGRCSNIWRATVVDAVVRALHLHLAAEFDDAARRNVEELGRRLRVAVHEVKHLPPEATEARVPAGHDRDPSDKKGRLHHVEGELSRAAIVQHLRDVGCP